MYLPQPLLLFLLPLLQDGDKAPEKPPQGFGQFLLPLVFIFAIFYFVLIRPERKKQKERTAMLAQIKKGTKVMTTSGIYGTVAQVQEDVVTLQVADNVRLKFNRAAIQDLLDGEGSKKSEPEKDSSGIDPT